jgi:putative transposase
VEFGVEPICRVLAEHGIKIAPSTFYETVTRRPSKQQVRDQDLVAVIEAERGRQKLLARFGARKMWLHLRGMGHDVARCTIERLYREQGWQGALRLKKIRTTIGDPAVERPTDRVDRQFWASRPNQLWVADFTYVATWAGTVYVAFIFDVFSRRIVGWRAATRMTTDLVLDTLEHAIWTRRQAGITDLSGLIHHTDAGSQYVSFAFTQRLVDEGVDPSVGSVGDAYDNALAESQIGLYKAELIRPEGPWRGVEHVEIETLNWVDFFNNERPHHSIDDLTPIGCRRTPLRCKEGPHADRLRQRNKPPDTPGRFKLLARLSGSGVRHHVRRASAVDHVDRPHAAHADLLHAVAGQFQLNLEPDAQHDGIRVERVRCGNERNLHDH